MKPVDLQSELYELAAAEEDAREACAAASGRMGVVSLRRAMVQMSQTHHRHARELRTAIARLGGEPPPGRADPKGVAMMAATAVAGVAGVGAMLEVLRVPVGAAARAARSAMLLDVGEDLHALVRWLVEEDDAHVGALKRWLETRAWEENGATV